MLKTLRFLLKSQKGQGLAEYALILVLISIAAFGAMTALGGDITTVFETISTKLVGGE